MRVLKEKALFSFIVDFRLKVNRPLKRRLIQLPFSVDYAFVSSIAGIFISFTQDALERFITHLTNETIS
ncbi:hypothetical protein D3C81_2021780 [compost metagenome]